jgi:hypothetical protein
MEKYNEHYKKLPIEPIELMRITLTKEELQGFIKGNIIKYALRAGHKEGEDYSKDVAKLLVYKGWLEDLNKSHR